eukprot:363746-Chlamydomonas_euryale.AAC.1
MRGECDVQLAPLAGSLRAQRNQGLQGGAIWRFGLVVQGLAVGLSFRCGGGRALSLACGGGHVTSCCATPFKCDSRHGERKTPSYIQPVGTF